MTQRYLVLFLVLLVLLSRANGQQTQTGLSCGTDPYVAQRIEADSAYRAFVLATRSTPTEKVDNETLYRIPVVFVVYHVGEAIGTGSNVSDADLSYQLDLLNRRYAGVAPFNSPNSNIQFELAKRTPGCAPFGGILRINASGVPNYSNQGVTSHDVGTALANSFPDYPNKMFDNFLVIRVVNTISFASGYALINGGNVFVNATGMKDRSDGNFLLAHEVGHVLSLFHTFYGSQLQSNYTFSCPANANPNTEGDYVADTDPHKEGNSGFCSPGYVNTCTGQPFGNLVYNNMNYSCGSVFSAGQVTRMRAFLQTSYPTLANNIYLTTPSSAEALKPISCQVGVGLTSSVGYRKGIQHVQFEQINRQSGDSPHNDGYYQDFSCSNKTDVVMGQSYQLSITALYTYAYRQVYIDFDNNGVFDEATERVVGSTVYGGTSVHTINFPTISTTGTYLRMRILVDEGNTPPTACYLPGNAAYGAGQVEDYAVRILSTAPPVCVLNTTLRSGLWTDPAVWSCGSVPTPADPVSIGHAITIPAGQAVCALHIHFNTGGRIVYEPMGKLSQGQ
ncbi:MAG: hypothetical protein EAZ91_19300 [Cytophagales bacterium]|nr:MAG: hypothetical protein EAZ91_19300 [Cytophagales bacterium]